VGTGGFEPPKSKQQIYSLSHLATLVYPHFKQKRAEEGTRTPDLLITNQWLYQLSYFGLFFTFKERPFVIGVANLITISVVAKKNKTFFGFFQKKVFESKPVVLLPFKSCRFTGLLIGRHALLWH
jgi:hypothetical protein